jgi:hypothetical protein
LLKRLAKSLEAAALLGGGGGSVLEDARRISTPGGAMDLGDKDTLSVE